MRLRARLTLAFAALAIVPAGLVGWATLSAVKTAFDSMLEARLDDTEALLRSEMDRLLADLERAVSALATDSPSIERMARELRLGTVDPASALPLAEGLMAGRRDLQVLFLIEGDGRVLSSGHLPARFGDRAVELARFAREESGELDLRWVEVRGEGAIDRAPALLFARPAGREPPARAAMHVVGGILVDEALARRLRALTGAEVRLLIDEEGALSEPEPVAGRRARRLALTGAGEERSGVLELSVSEAALSSTREQILAVLLGSAILAVLGAAIFGTLLASRITRPLDALAEGAGRIAEGDYESRVEARGSKEISALVDAFNAMTVEINASRDRIAAAERIAAWQGIARSLAHEIKNPLTPIAMSIETLRRTWKKRHPDFEEIFAESTQAILEEVGALQRLVTEFSSFARLPAPVLEESSPAELIEGALALFPEPPAGVLMERQIASDLPKVMADRDQIGQVLLNLFCNALQAIEANEGSKGRITLRAAVEENGRFIRIEVEDDGPGITAEHRAELFTPYFTTKETGTGLGLAISHRIVVEHRGQITVASEPGKGACISVLLPAVRVPTVGA